MSVMIILALIAISFTAVVPEEVSAWQTSENGNETEFAMSHIVDWEPLTNGRFRQPYRTIPYSPFPLPEQNPTESSQIPNNQILDPNP